jgi:hypothetical protein
MSDEATKAAWRALQVAATAFGKSTTGDTEAAKALSDAALAYAAARGGGAKPQRAATGDDGPRIPFGRSKNLPIAKADAKDLQWVLGALQKSIDDPEKARWRESNEALAEAIRSELEAR